MMRCRVSVSGSSVAHDHTMLGVLLGIKDERATVLFDGYAASDSVPLDAIEEAWPAQEEVTL